MLLLIVLILIILIFTATLRIKLKFDTVENDVNLTVLWIKPLFKSVITIVNFKPIMNLYIFNKKIMNIKIKGKKGKSKKINILEAANPKDIHVNTRYGFRDPFVTGIAYGAINIVSQFVKVESLDQTPDFLPDDDYIHLDATAEVNLGSTLLRLLKAKSNA
ncbi:MAG: hypothetical protein Q8920_14990 [Bacillota bacterium]|nr:hypothetical protein [Bacillota bacterium]